MRTRYRNCIDLSFQLLFAQISREPPDPTSTMSPKRKKSVREGDKSSRKNKRRTVEANAPTRRSRRQAGNAPEIQEANDGIDNLKRRSPEQAKRGPEPRDAASNGKSTANTTSSIEDQTTTTFPHDGIVDVSQQTSDHHRAHDPGSQDERAQQQPALRTITTSDSMQLETASAHDHEVVDSLMASNATQTRCAPQKVNEQEMPPSDSIIDSEQDEKMDQAPPVVAVVTSQPPRLPAEVALPPEELVTFSTEEALHTHPSSEMDIAAAGRQVLQQAAEVAGNDNMSDLASHYPETIANPDSQDLSTVAQASQTTWPNDLSTVDQREVTATDSLTAPPPMIDTQSDSARCGSLLKSADAIAAQVQGYDSQDDDKISDMQPKAGYAISEDIEPTTPSQLEKDLFGFEDDEPLPALENDSPHPGQVGAPPPTPASLPVANSSGLFTVSTADAKGFSHLVLPDLMSFAASDREDEARRQIALRAGCTIRDYITKFGRDMLHSQAKDMVRHRMLQEQREAEEFEEELKAHQTRPSGKRKLSHIDMDDYLDRKRRQGLYEDALERRNKPSNPVSPQTPQAECLDSPVEFKTEGFKRPTTKRYANRLHSTGKPMRSPLGQHASTTEKAVLLSSGTSDVHEGPEDTISAAEASTKPPTSDCEAHTLAEVQPGILGDITDLAASPDPYREIQSTEGMETDKGNSD